MVAGIPASRTCRDLQADFEPLGLTGDTPVTELPVHLREALQVGYESGQQLVAGSLRGGHVPEVNGWQLALHAFDYNLDHFQVGTVDTPQWRIEDPAARLVMRAGAALGGLWGNHAYEAAYLATYVDDLGEQLSGTHEYTLTLDPPPPNDAFWSLTMYDIPDYYLVQNDIERYSIGDRTPGVLMGPDGTITITISRSRPDAADAAANWLPAPAGDFRPILRIYMPEPAVLDGSYRLPAIRRIS